MFVDKVRVTFEAGDGGPGAVSFRHEKFVDRGGPDGGDGGDGGDVVLQASNNQNTLAAFRYHKVLKANPGHPGAKRRQHGKSGDDLRVLVPVGTVVMSGEDQTLTDLTTDGQTAVIAKGGKGGFGNAHFKSSTRQAPRVAEKGEPGEHLEVTLELKMIADVGLVGLPNAGKSTLLAAISHARPEIADYPFTTLHPNLGVVDIDSKNSLLFADIPGLIEGASQGKGLGDEFLRHVERTRVLVQLIDIYQDDVATAYRTIQAELKAYKIDLSKLPQIVALSKVEGVDEEIIKDKISELQKVVPKKRLVLALSAKSGEGIQVLLRAVQKLATKQVKAAKKATKTTLPVITLPADDDSWTVKRDGDNFVVSGPKIERFARRTDFNNSHGLQRLRDIMRKMGIMQELQRQNIESGQKIIIGTNSLEY